jgi:hypothetical protein
VPDTVGYGVGYFYFCHLRQHRELQILQRFAPKSRDTFVLTVPR